MNLAAVTLLEAAKILQNATSNTVIITKDKDGSCCLEAGKDNLTEVDGIKTTVADTIGAGDSHIGQIMASRANGCSWAEALSQANKVSAHVVAKNGAGLTDSEYQDCFAR